MIVLILDDCVHTAEFFAMTLEKEIGCECQISHTYEDAIYKAKQVVFDVVICDVDLKEEKDGIDFVNWVNREYHNINVIVYTGLDQEVFKDKYKKLNGVKVDLFMKKPINKDELVHHVQQLGLMKGTLKMENSLQKEQIEKIIDENIKTHKEDCIKDNDLIYVKKPNLIAQTSIIFAIVLALIGGVVGYWKIEAAQNERQSVVEVNVRMLGDKVKEHDEILKTKFEENSRKQDEIIHLLRSIKKVN